MDQSKVPFSIEAEEAVLGWLLSGSSSIADYIISRLTNESFFVVVHQGIFNAAASSCGVVDELTVFEKLKGTSVLDGVGGRGYLDALVQQKPALEDPLGTLEVYCDIIKEKERLRFLVSAATEAARQAQVENKSASAIVEELEKKITESTTLRSTKIPIYGPGQIAKRRLEGLKKRGEDPKIRTGFESLDMRLVSPFAPGSMTVIAGIPKAGKTSLKTHLVFNWIKAKHSVVLFSLEQLFDGEADRLDSVVSGISLASLKYFHDWPSDDPRRKLLKETNEWYDNECKLWHVPTRMMSLFDSYSILKKIKKENGKIDFAVYDLFDRLTDINTVKDRVPIIAVKIAEVMAMAEDIGCHLVILAQLHEPEKPRKPVPSDVKWLKPLYEHCSLFLLLDRPSLRDNSMVTDFLDVIIGAQRDGPTLDEVRFIVDNETLKLTEAEGYNEQQPKRNNGEVPVVLGGDGKSDAAG